MFTGIVEELGEVVELDHGPRVSTTDRARPPRDLGRAHGGSIAVNGVCLTVVEHSGDRFTVDVMAETLAAPPWRAGARRRREPRARDARGRPVRRSRRPGPRRRHRRGRSREPGERWEVVTFTLPDDLARYVVLKGSVTVDGVSLTVSDVADSTFAVSLIPTTLDADDARTPNRGRAREPGGRRHRQVRRTAARGRSRRSR